MDIDCLLKNSRFTKMLLITKPVFVGNQDIKLNYLPGAKFSQDTIFLKQAPDFKGRCL